MLIKEAYRVGWTKGIEDLLRKSKASYVGKHMIQGGVAGGLGGSAVGAGVGALAAGEGNRGKGALIGGLAGAGIGGGIGALKGKVTGSTKLKRRADRATLNASMNHRDALRAQEKTNRDVMRKETNRLQELYRKYRPHEKDAPFYFNSKDIKALEGYDDAIIKKDTRRRLYFSEQPEYARLREAEKELRNAHAANKKAVDSVVTRTGRRDKLERNFGGHRNYASPQEKVKKGLRDFKNSFLEGYNETSGAS